MMTDHELNKLLAQWAGVKIWELHGLWYTQDLWGGPRYECTWDPLWDPRQMELVKVGLRKRGIFYNITWDFITHHVELLVNQEKFWGHHEHELRAFALVIEQLGEPTP